MKGIQSLVTQPSPSVFQAYSSLVLSSCPQLPYNPLVCLGTISSSQPTSYEDAGQQGLSYIHLQPGAFHRSPAFCTSTTVKCWELVFHLGNDLTFKHRKRWDTRTNQFNLYANMEFFGFYQLTQHHLNTAVEMQISKMLCRHTLWTKITEINLQNYETKQAGKCPGDPQQGCVLWVGNVERMELETDRWLFWHFCSTVHTAKLQKCLEKFPHGIFC